MKGKVFENGFAFYTERLQFYYVANAYEPKLMKFKDPKLRLEPPFFIVVPPKQGFSFSERIEVHIAHPEAGVIVLIEDEERRLDYGAAPPRQP